MKYVIIGGVAGGATAAARLRRIDEQAEIVLLEKGKYISYANCGLPYYIGGVIEERGKLLVQTPESFGQRFRIDVRVENEVVAIDTERKTLAIRKAGGEEYEETYDKLLLSPGSYSCEASVGRHPFGRHIYASQCGGYRPDQVLYCRQSGETRRCGGGRIYRA